MDKIPLSVFLLGAAIVLFYALVSAVVTPFVTYNVWVRLWQDAPDMRILGPMMLSGFLSGAAMGLVAYWLRFSALIQLPPLWARAFALANQVQTVTTLKKVEQQKNPPAEITTTIQETKIGSVPTL